MWRLQLFWIAWVFVLTAEAIPMAAQGQSYEQNALRLDTNFGDVRIVRGVEGTVVGRIGVFRGVDVTQVVAASPNAVAEAREFQRNYRPGTIVLGVGLISLGASVGASQNHDGIDDRHLWLDHVWRGQTAEGLQRAAQVVVVVQS